MIHSESEETTRLAFDTFLDQCYPEWPRLWQDGEEPPDYRLDLGKTTFAVEVTALMKKVPLGRVDLPIGVIADELYRLGAEAERVIREAGVLHGTFTVSFPRPIPELSRRRLSVIACLWEAIAPLSGAPPGSQREFLRIDGRRFMVIKVSEAGAELLMGGPTYAAWRSDALIELTQLLADRLHVKGERLRKTPGPAILLLDERYPFADTQMYSECERCFPALERFHTVFVSRQGAPGILLKSGFPGLSGVWDGDPAT